MIQRWQTVWLLLAAVLVCVFCFFPMATVTDVDAASTCSATAVFPSDLPAFLVINGLEILMLLIAIFMYNDLHRQKLVALVSALLIAISLVTEAAVIFNFTRNGSETEILGSGFLLVGALAFTLLAYRGIRADERLLRAADRLR